MPDSETPSPRERLIQLVGGYSKAMYLYRSLRPRWLWRLSSPFGRPITRYVNENGLAIQRGPFRGLKFPERALGHTNHMGAKLVGTYEPGVVDFLSIHVPRNEVFADLGSGDGVFCVGAALLGPIRSIGYETNGFERRIAEKIARANGKEIETRGLADHESLRDLPQGRLLILCDIEGFEEEVLDPVEVPRLRTATMIVEAHDQFRPNVITTLTERFSETHEIGRIFAEPADASGFPELSGWDREAVDLITFDGHVAGESWLTFVPHQVP